MRSYVLYSFLFLLLLAFVLVLFQKHPEPFDDFDAVFADIPNQTESDLRKQASLFAACSSVADLIQVGAITEPAEAVAAFRIDTANLRSDEPWCSIQERIEMFLRKAESVESQEKIIRDAIDRLRCHVQ